MSVIDNWRDFIQDAITERLRGFSGAEKEEALKELAPLNNLQRTFIVTLKVNPDLRVLRADVTPAQSGSR